MLRKLAGMILRRRGTPDRATQSASWKPAPDDWQRYYPDPARELRRRVRAAEVASLEWAFAYPVTVRYQ